ncbi:MAG TPA: C39 family peptidase [Chloroflexota bacterium]|nr:C39 family peptidase [Chloroflexota bacterium]
MPAIRWTRRGFVIAIPALLLGACGGRVPAANPTASPATAPAIIPTLTPRPSPTAAATATAAPVTSPTAANARVASPAVISTATTVPTVQPTEAPTAPTEVPGTTRLVRHGVTELAGGTLVGVARAGEVLSLARGAGSYPASGTATSPELSAAFPFDTLVASWNATAPPGTALRCEARVRATDRWSGWYALGQWSAERRGSIANQRDALGTVDVDTLKLVAPARVFQYRVTLTTTSPSQTPTLRLVAVNYANLQGALSGPRVALSPGWARDLPVPVQSQLLQEANLAWDVCSPTSLAMVLQYWKVAVSVSEVIDGVRDQTTGIYGDWPFNTAYAGLRGMEAYVNRFTSIDDLKNEIAASRPVITSIRFAAGELANAPITSASGHLLVVRGFTPAGDIIVNDPVAPSLAGVRRIYRRDQFANVWLKHGGIVYQVRPLGGAG